MPKRKNTDLADENIAPENTVPERNTETTPTEDATATETPAAETDRVEDKPAPRSLEWWKAKAREHQATIDTLTAERNALQARLDTAQQREVESLVTGKLHDPSDLFRFGPPLAELLDDNGTVDPAKVDAALAAVVQAHPHLSVRHGISPAAPASAVTANDPIDRDAKQNRTFHEWLQTGHKR
ncbi:hypothetical protein [Mycolicibacterium pulveris]|uniref:hypothetical protein n=1 Tax=Mycolicibacterium pulveris TaxID=36813 RepID=UPI003CEB75A6